MQFQWYPGHMTKARRAMQEDIKLIDVIIELVDSRVPYSSKNPDIDTLANGKSRILLMNKYDLADNKVTDQWIKYYEDKGYFVAKVNSKNGKGVRAVNDVIQKACKEKIERDRKRGIINRPIRAMIVGIPNVGKSSFINKIGKQIKAKVEDRPGVTRGNQWYTIAKDLEMLDTPGILWPKFYDERVGQHLAFTGAIKDNILDIELLAVDLLESFKKDTPDEFLERFKITKDILDENDGYELLQIIGRKRGMVISGGEIDTLRASTMLLDEYRNGKFGKITLEFPEDL